MQVRDAGWDDAGRVLAPATKFSRASNGSRWKHLRAILIEPCPPHPASSILNFPSSRSLAMPKSEDAGWSSHLSLDSDALMVDSLSTLVSRRSEILHGQRMLVSCVCATLLIALGAPARGESSGSKIIIRDPAATTELQQPKHFTPVASKPPAAPVGQAVPDTEQKKAKATNQAVPDIKQKNVSQNLLYQAPTVAGSETSDPSTSDPSSSRRQPPGEVLQASPVDATTYLLMRAQARARQANFQIESPEAREAAEKEAEFDAAVAKDPCAAMPSKPFDQYGISIAMPAGEFPTDNATACWGTINESAGPLAGMRYWGTSTFAWEATCLCHRPLYFEETNLERYGYGCCECMQPAASAAHFFGTIPALPYCMAVDCPGECNYTLGQYRPGSCVPRQCMWPPCSPRAILAEGGVWTGMIFLIP